MIYDVKSVVFAVFGSNDPRLRALVWLVVGLVVAGLADIVLRRVVGRIVGRTATKLDDHIAQSLRVPITGSVVLIAAWYSIQALGVEPEIYSMARGILATVGVALWTSAGMAISRVILLDLSKNHSRYSMVQPRTLPVFSIAGRGLVFGFAAYALLIAWKVDVTAWLASAGVIGIAVGFAAQESLSNLFAGIFIIVDAPYKLGDFLVLDSGERGRVTEIGFRSTRILTEDDIEVILPNAVMAGAMITNESGGPYEKERVQVPVGVAYGVDIERVKEILKDEVSRVSMVVNDEASLSPVVHFEALGASSLDLMVKAYIRHPEDRAQAIDALLTAIYKRLNAEGIEIPFEKRDVYLYEMGEPDAG